MKRVGVYGGTFAPVHIGHIRAAESFVKEAELDELLVVPALIPPHKQKTSKDSPEDRVNMLKLAFANSDKIRVSDIEIARGGVSYTWQTLEGLYKEGQRLVLLVGTDMLLTLDSWRCPEKIFEYADIFAVAREEGSLCELISTAERYKREYGASVTVMHSPAFDISSTEVRELIARGIDPDGFVLRSVTEYIRAHGLYGAKESFALDGMSEKRRLHSIGVAVCAFDIASRLGKDGMKAYTAGVLHDSAKELSDSEMLTLCKEADIDLSPDDIKAGETLHQYASAAIASLYFGCDGKIADMIMKHCTADRDMDVYDCILFLADYIEEGRSHPMCIALREEFYKEPVTEERVLEFARRAAKNTLCYLEKKGAFIHGKTKLFANG